MTKNITVRQRRKAATRAQMLKAARKLFSTGDYHAVTIRDLAVEAKRSTGAIFTTFSGKEELFTEAMGFPPPVDGPLTRAAPMLLEALQWAIREAAGENHYTNVNQPLNCANKAHEAIALATSPLDGEAWARHLSAIRRDEPHTLAAGEAAPSVPSDGAADQ